MDTLDQTLFTELDPLVSTQGVALVEVGVSPGSRRTVIHLVIYSAKGITHDDCRRVTRAAGESLEASNTVKGNYALEVSSPGTSRILKEAREFELFRGAPVLVVLHEAGPDSQITGQVAGTRQSEEEAVVVLREDGEESVIPWSRIAKARLVPENPGRGGNGGKGS